MVVCLWNQLRAGRANLGGDDICKRGALWKMEDVLVVAALWTPGLRSEWTAFEFGTPLWNGTYGTPISTRLIFLCGHSRVHVWEEESSARQARCV